MSSNEKFTKDDSSWAEIKRRFHANPFVFAGTVVVLVIVIIAFVLVPAIVPSAGGLGGDRLTFGYYDGKPLVYAANNYFTQARQWYANEARNYGLDEYMVWNYAYKDFVRREAIFGIMKDADYEPPESLVDKKMAEHPRFLDDNGKFSRFLYNQYPSSERLAMRGEIKSNLIVERYYADMENLRSSDAEKDFVGAMARRQRSFKLAALGYDGYPDAEAAAFARENPALFVSLSLSQITTGKEKDALRIAAEIADGTLAFEDAARNRSTDEYKDRGGNAGARLAHELRALVEDEAARAALAALEKGALGGPFKTAGGWTVFRAEEDARPADTADAATLALVRLYINNFERGLIEDYLLGKAAAITEAAKAPAGADNRVFAAGDGRAAARFADAAADAGAAVSDFGPLPVNYGNLPLFSALSSFGGIAAFGAPYGDPRGGAAFDENFWSIAFGAAPLTASKPFTLAARQAYVALLFPLRELDDDAAAENSRDAFSGWLPDAAAQSIRDAPFSSPKFEDRFDAAFQYLFPEQFYQHSVTTFGF